MRFFIFYDLEIILIITTMGGGEKYMKKILAGAGVAAVTLSLFAGSAFAATPGAAVKNDNANGNACWGQDRSFYASQGFFPENMDIKQSFPGDVGEQRAAWVATYCDPHGPAQ